MTRGKAAIFLKALLLLTLKMVTLNQLGDVTISILNDLHNPVVTLLGIIPLIDDESVDFVEHEDSFDFGLPSLSNDCGGLWTDTLNAVNHNNCTI